VLIAVLGTGLVLDRGGSTVEAATIEGVVLENAGGTLTVQTLDALESVQVPGDVVVSDVAGASIELGGIEVGQVVVIDLERRGRDAIARRVQRFRESIEAWCSDNTERCRLLTAELDRAYVQCDRAPGACLVALDRLDRLRVRASDSAALEELRQACRDGRDGACRALVAFCREHPETCGGLMPQEPPLTDRPLVENRLRTLLAECNAGDEGACRQLAQHCIRFLDLCPADLVPLPEPTRTNESRPSTAGDAHTPDPSPASPRPVDVAPTPERPAATPASELSDRPRATPVLEPSRPTETPVRDGGSGGASDERTPEPSPEATSTPPRDVATTPAAGSPSGGSPADRPSDR
jgi:hypothetical protein